MVPTLAVLLGVLQGPVLKPIEVSGQQVYRTSHALLVADDLAPQGEPAFGNSIREFSKVLVDDCGFPKENVAVLTGADANHSRIVAELNRLKDPRRVSKQDRVIVVFAMHGELADSGGMFKCADAQSLPMKEVSQSVLSPQGIPAKHVLFLADSCHSGSIARPEPMVSYDPGTPLGTLLQRPFRAVWAGANVNGIAVSDDSSQRTKMIGAIMDALNRPDTYKDGVALESDVQSRARAFLPLCYAPVAQGEFLFAVKPERMVKEEQAKALEQQRQADGMRSAMLAYQSYQKLLEAQSALAALDRTADPEKWAQAQNSVGSALLQLSTGNRAANLKGSIDAFELGLEVYKAKPSTPEWASFNNNLGVAYGQLPTGSRKANVEKAIGCFEAALKVRTEQALPQLWAQTQLNLGTTYKEVWNMTHDPAELEKSVACFKAALRVNTEATSPDSWGKLQNNIAIALRLLPLEGDEHQNEAIGCFENALRVHTEKDYPIYWAMTKTNLGNTYIDLRSGDRLANFQKAIQCYQDALRVRTERDFPLDWASTTTQMGQAIAQLPNKDHDANLRKSIDLFTSTLRVRTKASLPIPWALTQKFIAMSYADMQEGDSKANEAKAAEHFRAALTVFNPLQAPAEYADTNLMLGMLLLDMGQKDDAKKCLEAARDTAKRIGLTDHVRQAEEGLKQIGAARGLPLSSTSIEASS